LNSPFRESRMACTYLPRGDIVFIMAADISQG
jgi:hypothetical protein